VHARNIAFDRSTITVAAGSTVTLVFINEDDGVDHNLALDIAGTAKDTCRGPCQTTQTFTAPGPGSHFFFCTIHASMFGTFAIQ
jgi:plastocyanin